MQVFVCGNNNFSQLNWNFTNFNLGDNFISVDSNCDTDNISTATVKPLLKPSSRLSLLNNVKAEDVDVHFTWSRCIVSLKRHNGSYTTFITGFNTKESASDFVLENSICACVVDGNGEVLLKKNDKLSVVLNDDDGMSQPCSVTICNDENLTSPVCLQHVAGGHKDIYSVYDGVSFGKFEFCHSPKSSHLKSNDEKNPSERDITVRIQHIDFVTPIKEVSCGKEHVLLLSVTGSVYSHGLSSRGQLGHGEIVNETSPRLIDALDGLPMKTVMAGGWHSVSVSDIGDLYVWGWNESGQLGLNSIKKGDEHVTDDGDVGILATPVCHDTPNGENVKDVACGSRHTVVLTDSGQIFMCGWNGYGQLGLGDTCNRDTLTRITGLTGHAVFAGQWNSAFICTQE